MLEGFQFTFMIANGILCCYDCFEVELPVSRRRRLMFQGKNENSKKDIDNNVLVY